MNMSDENKMTDEEHELKKIRMKKMQEMLEAKKRIERREEFKNDVGEKVEYLLRAVMTPEAYNYFSKLKENEPQVYQQIYNELIGPDVMNSIDYLIAIVSKRGVPRKIPVDPIIYLERKIKGVKSKIRVQRKDEMMDLGSFLSK